MELITIAIPKGRIMNETLQILSEIGMDCSDISEETRKLIFTSKKANIRFIIAKPFDIPTYVEYGAADLGIVGKDVIMEEDKDVYELLDLKLGFCRMVVAGQKDKIVNPVNLRIATKYTRVAEVHFMKKGRQAEIIKLNGSIEIAPIIGLSHKIVDIVSTGKTLKENNLIELEEIAKITARLIANKVSFRLKSERIQELISNLSIKLDGEKSV